MKVFISGGCKNGKSFYAQRLSKAQDNGKLYYVATMSSVDAEDDVRIIRHRQERDGWGFVTVEQPTSIEQILERCDHGGSYLLDSVTALLANEMFDADGNVDPASASKIINGITQIMGTIENIVIVSDYIYSDALVYDPMTDLYRKSLAQIDRAVAQMSDVVLEVSFSNVIVHRVPQDERWANICSRELALGDLSNRVAPSSSP